MHFLHIIFTLSYYNVIFILSLAFLNENTKFFTTKKVLEYFV